MKRSRILYLALALVTVLLGLASRRYRSELPSFFGEYAGDALWATMVYFVAAVVWPRASHRSLGIGAIAFAFCIELSQLYHAPWIDGLRENRWAALVLGQGFLWSDLLCYTAGVGIALAIDASLRGRRTAGRDGAA